MWRRADNCGISAVTVHHGRRHSCHYAEADPHGPCDQQILLLLDTVIDFPVVQVVQFPGWWSRRAENCGFHSCSSCLVVYMPVVVHDRFGVFLGPCTQVHGQG